MLLEKGLNVSSHDNLIDAGSATEIKTRQLHCYLPLTIAEEIRSDFGEFIIKIISPKKMSREYSINLEASDRGQVIEHDYHSDNIQWTKTMFSSEITPTKLN